jgi:NAD(P)-dependent dehydrogenase (short-subunit alcohol dehydrogenase family)
MGDCNTDNALRDGVLLRKIPMKTGRLDGKTAVITGSTSGIGESVARLFAEEGAEVVVSGRRQEKGEAVCADILSAGGEAIFVRADTTVDGDIDRLFASALDRFGRIDILVNNAGTILMKPFIEVTSEDWDRIVALDGRAYFVCMQKVLPIMEKQGAGSIVNITSLNAVKPMPPSSIYSFAKAGVTQMSKIVALEYADKGIRINCLLPGATTTEMTEALSDNEAVRQTLPLKRHSTAREQAYAALFLASDEAAYVTGASLIVDGGWYPH